MWKQRGLSLKGKVIIINTLIGSLFTYYMQVLPKISNAIQVKLKRIIEDFIWNGRKPKIRFETLTLSIDQGGLKLFDINNREKSIKISWLKRIQDMSSTSQKLAKYFIKPIIPNEDFWRANFSVNDVKNVCNSQGFWKDMIESWAEYNFHKINDIETTLKSSSMEQHHILELIISLTLLKSYQTWEYLS